MNESYPTQNRPMEQTEQENFSVSPKRNIIIKIIGVLMFLWGIVGFIILILSQFVAMSIIISNTYFLVGAILVFIITILLIISGIGLFLYKRWAIISFKVLLALQIVLAIVMFLNPEKISGGTEEFVELIIYALIFVYIYINIKTLSNI